MSFIVTLVVEAPDPIEAEIVAGEIKKMTEEVRSILGVERTEG